jgi:hypothetical protein
MPENGSYIGIMGGKNFKLQMRVALLNQIVGFRVT